MSVEVKNLLKIYGTQKAVNDISFRVAKGEIVGFLGPNGAGKSTTMKMISGYLQATAGQIRVCGKNVTEDPLYVKRKIGYLPEANALYYDMYVKEYLTFIGELHQLNGNLTQKMDEVIQLTGLTAEYRKKIGQLSKGYKQRVGLAAALIHDPEVLILDEPTSGLDPNQIMEIREVIKEQGKNKTVLFSSHILQEVEAICNRVIIIHHGKIVADDLLSRLQTGPYPQQRVMVTFKEAVDKHLLEQIREATSLEISESQGTNRNYSHYKIHTASPEVVRKQILEIALQHNLNIVSLQSETVSLEEVFRSLTQ